MIESDKERLEKLTTDLILELRRAYLAAGASPLKHWDQLQARVRMAARTSSSLAEWVTSVSRSLNLSSPANSLSLATKTLGLAIAETCYPEEWLALVESEHTYLMACARLEAQRRKQQPQPSEEELISEAIGER